MRNGEAILCKIYMVYHNNLKVYLSEVGLTQISKTNHEILCIVCHVGIHVDFTSVMIP